MSDNNPPPLPPPLNPPPGISTSSSNGSSSAADPFLEGAAHNSLDHALLESLFYNEMALLDNNSNNSNNASNGHGLLLVEPQQDQQPVNDDVDVQVEQDLLKDFGVTDRAAPMAAQPPPQQQQQSIQHLLPSGRGIRHNVVVPAVTGSSSAGAAGGSVGSTGANVGTIPSGTSNTVPTQRNHMVSQFATLAERLGIDLPPQVLSKLTNNTNNTIQSVDAIAPQPAPSTSSPTTSASNHHHTNNDNTNNNTSTLTEQLQTAATASIAAATASTTSKRKDDNTSNNNNNNKLPYSKRRKKPRLDDCDRRLAELQAEHELLKKHLQTITSQSQKISQERKQAETKMRQMFHTNAPDSQLQPAVHHFTEMYSDYGKKRHQELSFHLEQLQRLATPTNFTKMGLWTLGGAGGQSKHSSHNKNKRQYNPINSILQKELGISASQGRKILDQREKIRTLCDNLKVTQSLLHKLQSLCQQKTQIFYERMKLCQEILTPRQVVKLLLWIDENSSTLEQVCPGWGSEVK